MSKKITIGLAVVALFIAVSVGLYYQNPKSATLKDAFFEEAVRKVTEINSYSQYVETQTLDKSGMKIKIAGDYDINQTEKEFWSKSTTTISIPNPESKKEDQHSFTLENISIEDDVYTRINTASVFLKGRFEKSNEWLHFTKNAIPPRYHNISIAGSIVNNLNLFSADGKYLKLVEKQENELIGEIKTKHYSLLLSERAFEKEGIETLGTVIEHIGKDGAIDVWIEEDTADILRIEFKNPPYHSSTNISNINSVEKISPLNTLKPSFGEL